MNDWEAKIFAKRGGALDACDAHNLINLGSSQIGRKESSGLRKIINLHGKLGENVFNQTRTVASEKSKTLSADISSNYTLI